MSSHIHTCRPPAVYDLIDRNTRRLRAQLASLTVIDDVGHYVRCLASLYDPYLDFFEMQLPAVKPRDTAAQIFRNLQNHQANLSKL
jgi:hypothetical protein